MKKNMVLGFLILALPLAGCGSVDAQQTQNEEAAAPNNLLACDLVIGDMEDSPFKRAPDHFSSIGESMSAEQVYAILDDYRIIEKAIEAADAKLSAALTNYSTPYAQLQESVDSGSANIEMETYKITENAADILELCVDAGFDISQAGKYKN